MVCLVTISNFYKRTEEKEVFCNNLYNGIETKKMDLSLY